MNDSPLKRLAQGQRKNRFTFPKISKKNSLLVFGISTAVLIPTIAIIYSIRTFLLSDPVIPHGVTVPIVLIVVFIFICIYKKQWDFLRTTIVLLLLLVCGMIWGV